MLVTCTLPLPVDSVLLSPAMLTLHVIECARCPIVYPRVPQRRWLTGILRGRIGRNKKIKETKDHNVFLNEAERSCPNILSLASAVSQCRMWWRRGLRSHLKRHRQQGGDSGVNSWQQCGGFTPGAATSRRQLEETGTSFLRIFRFKKSDMFGFGFKGWVWIGGREAGGRDTEGGGQSIS